jgi:2-C-methyl-D-erythritol 4-phosphate cytidylyltransferase
MIGKIKAADAPTPALHDATTLLQRQKNDNTPTNDTTRAGGALARLPSALRVKYLKKCTADAATYEQVAEACCLSERLRLCGDGSQERLDSARVKAQRGTQ